MLPAKVPIGAAGAFGTVRKLASALAALAPSLPDTNLAEKLYTFPTLRPVKLVPACHAPVPTRYCVVQPAGAVIAFNTTPVVLLLAIVGIGAADADGTVIVLTADHSLSTGTLYAPVPL